MVEFGEIIEKTIRVGYTMSDVNGCKVTGVATYNKEQKLTRVTGTIKKDEQLVANFNTMGDKINLLDCDSEMMNVAVEVADAALDELKNNYPNE